MLGYHRVLRGLGLEDKRVWFLISLEANSANAACTFSAAEDALGLEGSCGLSYQSTGLGVIYFKVAVGPDPDRSFGCSSASPIKEN